MLTLLLGNLLILLTPTASALDSVQNLASIEVVASLKQQRAFEQSASVTTLPFDVIENRRILSSQDLSLIAPNFYQPDYGSKMTSSIYVRGMGARIDQPAMGMYIDNMPILNKSNYDTDFYDIYSIDLMRGPQGTLYGRNSIGGTINIQTLSPFNYQGTRINAFYGSANTFGMKLSTYHRPKEQFAVSVAINHMQSDGFYINMYDGEKCDRFLSDGGRVRLQWKTSEKWTLDNITSINIVKQDGFAYALYNEQSGISDPINHNDICSYDRTMLTNGFTARYTNSLFRIESTTSYQGLNDNMVLDQDFLPASYFTLTQKQREHAVTQEAIIKSNMTEKKWQWLTGIFGFYKHLAMSAPVTFKQYGIEKLIIENANKGIQKALPDGELLIQETEFPIYSDFTLPTFGASLYHQSAYDLGNWNFTAGLRVDYERATIRYANSADIHYRFNLTMPNYKALRTEISGTGEAPFVAVLPKLTILRHFKSGNIYATITRGYKAGGFNTQIFSDILQSRMMTDLMSDLGMYPEAPVTTSDISTIRYKPEYSWNYEVGTSLSFFDKRWHINTVLFYIDCTDQQLTVFPPGQGTGRMMSNAGHTRSFGLEFASTYTHERISLQASYGYTNARFIAYNDGKKDYAGNFIPYAPQNTMAISAEYKWPIKSKWLECLRLQADVKGIGRIYWNESNTLYEPFYAQLGAAIFADIKNSDLTFSLYGKNLTNKEFNTFYFKSVGNSFVQKGKPIQVGINIAYSF